jgi:hypothetical protein
MSSSWMPCLRALATITGSTTSTYLDGSRGATHLLRTDAMKERGLRSKARLSQPGAARLTVVRYTRFTPNVALRTVIEQHRMDSATR